MLRLATDADLDAVVSLAYDEEVAWFGEAESSREEIAEYVAFHGGVAAGEVLDEDGRVRGFALVSHDGEAVLLVEVADPEPAYGPLVARLLECGADRLEASVGDPRRIAWLEAHGWTHSGSSFDLECPVDPVEPPVWPAGIGVTPFRVGVDDEAVHEFVYVDAAFAAVPGHPERTLEQWRVVMGATVRGFIARRDGRQVGWVSGRLLDDGRGWVPQLAVAPSERRAGLGRALLLHSLGDLVAAGATALGLGVQAANDGAIGLYRSVGLEVVKEWRTYTPPPGPSA